MIFDTHMHCRYSIDSKMNIDEAKAAAEKLGIGMIITEHWDEDYPTNPEAFVFDIADYFARCGPYRSKKLLLGIEVGMQESTAANDDALGKKYPFDFILGSMHCMNGRDMYEAKTYNGKAKQEAVREFLLATAENLKLHDNFDSFAHIDYMCRYMPYEDKELVYAEAPELFDAVFRLLVEKDKAIEINTRRLDNPQAVEHLLVLYKRYRELGGRYATLGSDAHYQEHVGRRLDIAREMAEAAGLVPVYFEQRKMQRMML